MAWAGGKNGREIIDRLLPQIKVNNFQKFFILFIKNLLSNNGSFYLIVIEENNPNEIIYQMTKEGFNSFIILKK